MPKDKEPLTVELAVSLGRLTRELAKANTKVAKTAKRMEDKFDKASRRSAGTFNRIDKAINGTSVAVRGLTGAIAGAFSVREIQRFADSWTVANNKIAAASQAAGRQARSLSKINDIADETRSGLTETADLYAKLLRATKGVAKSEVEVAKATELVNKAFKAGGAAASEQAAGILQLAQGLSSGILQGDELRSIRENAPLVAQAIADEFGVTIGQLKQLGADGELTSERVFRAILKSQPKIEAAFSKTNSTIGEGFTALRNALTEYIGLGDQSVGATQKITNALQVLAENIDLVVAAGGVLAGRFIGPVLLGLLGKASDQVHAARAAMVGLSGGARAAAASMGVLRGALGLLGGPFGLVITALTTLPLILESTDDKVASLTSAAQKAVSGLDSFAAASKRAREEQDKLQGKVTAATAAMLTQSRAELQRSLRELRKEYQDMADDIRGVGLFDNSELSDPIANIRLQLEQIKRLGGENRFLEDIHAGLKELSKGGGNIAEMSQKLEYLAGVGDEVFGVFDRFNAALEDSSKIDFSSASSDLTAMAQTIGGFEAELDRVFNAKGPDEMRAALVDLANSMFDAADASKRLRKVEIDSLAKMLRSAKDSEVAIEAVEEALKGNIEQAQKLLEVEAPFKGIEDSAVSAKGHVDALTQSLIDNAAAALDAADREYAARRQYGQSRIDGARIHRSKVSSSAIETIKRFEGYREKPYWDVNAYRAGFGSDTVELADGTIQKVTKGMTVSLEDANRDLVRRVGEFQDGIINTIGRERWDGFSESQQASLTSIAYNYGSLPKRILPAVRSGDNQDIENAINGLGGDNNGINRSRRQAEAGAFSSSTIDTTEKENKALRDQYQVRRDLLDLAQKEVENAELEASLAGKSSAEQARLRTEYRLLAEAKAQGIDLNEKIAGSEQTYGEKIKATAAAVGEYVAMREKQKKTDGDVISRQNTMIQAQNTLAQGLSDAIFEGKSFADVLGNLAKQLAKAALQAALLGENGLFSFFGGGANAKGGGGGAGGFLSKLFSADGGGFTGPGPRSGGVDGKGGFPAILHPNETVIDHTKSRFSGSGGNSLTVNIHNAPEGQHRVQQSPDGRSLDIYIQEKALDAVTSPKGRRRMNQAFGIKPTPQGA